MAHWSDSTLFCYSWFNHSIQRKWCTDLWSFRVDCGLVLLSARRSSWLGALFDCRESRSIDDLWGHGLARQFASWCKPTQSCSCIGWASWADAWTWAADDIIPCTFLLRSIDKHVMNMQHTFEAPCDWLCSQTLLGACKVVTPSCQPSSHEWFD